MPMKTSDSGTQVNTYAVQGGDSLEAATLALALLLCRDKHSLSSLSKEKRSFASKVLTAACRLFFRLREQVGHHGVAGLSEKLEHGLVQRILVLEEPAVNVVADLSLK